MKCNPHLLAILSNLSANVNRVSDKMFEYQTINLVIINNGNFVTGVKCAVSRHFKGYGKQGFRRTVQAFPVKTLNPHIVFTHILKRDSS